MGFVIQNDTTALSQDRERAVLVGVERPGYEWSLEDSLAELERLADTAGADTVARASQKLEKLNPRTFIGSGKAEEVADLARDTHADVVIFDDELSPSQQSNLESIVGKNVKVIDRTALILDIFALHATSREGVLQVRLAQNQYLLPRLRGMWSHLASNRMGGGVGSRFGEGESQLEVDRRMVRKRITSIQRELKQLSEIRALQRQNRYQSGIFKVAIAGYTNAGKSSLLNTLTDSEVLSYDKLFATLDSTTRKYHLPEGREITLTDTVGFIQKLPTNLVEAFKSTLDEIVGADLILHLVDISSTDFELQIKAVEDTFEQIGAQNIRRLMVFNKIDLITDMELQGMKQRYPEALFVSAHSQAGIDELIDRIGKIVASNDAFIEACIPYDRGDLVSLVHKRGTIVSEEHEEKGTLMRFRISPSYESQFSEYRV